MDHSFFLLIHTLFGFDQNTPTTQAVAWTIKNLDSVWEYIQKQGEYMEKTPN